MQITLIAIEQDRVFERRFDVGEGALLADAVALSGIAEAWPELIIDPEHVGIWNRRADWHQVLRDGDRVEIYRPLQADPKTARRQRAAQRPLLRSSRQRPPR